MNCGRPNNAFERTVEHRSRTVLAMDCVLAGAEAQHGRPLNSVVRAHSPRMDNLAIM